SNNSGCEVFVISEDRTAIETDRIHTMMACGGDRLLEGPDRVVADQNTDRAPRFAWFEAVQAMAGGNASLATRTIVEIDFEGILLAGLRRGQRQQITVVSTLQRGLGAFVLLHETPHSCDEALFFQQFVNKRTRFLFCKLGHA